MWSKQELISAGTRSVLFALSAATMMGYPARAVAQPGSTGRDSAGIRIVESRAPRERWQLSAQPSLRLGSASADSNRWFDGVAGAARLPDGSLAIANCADPVLRWFTREGAFRQGAGRTGEGPGEFGGGECRRNFRFWPLTGDSIATWEHSARQLQIFDPSGKYAREVTLRHSGAQGAHPNIVGGLSNGALVVFVRDESRRRPTGDTWRETLTFHWYNASGTYGGRIAQLPGYSFVQWEFRVATGQIRDVSARPFGPPAAWAAHGDNLYYTPGDRFEVHAYALDGSRRLIIRRLIPARPVTREMVDFYKRRRAALNRTRAESLTVNNMERLLGAREFPAMLPAVSDLKVDGEGLLWIREYPAPQATTVTWSIFDASGQLLAELDTPRSPRILDVGRNHVVILGTDSQGAEEVSVYSVTRRPAGSAATGLPLSVRSPVP